MVVALAKAEERMEKERKFQGQVRGESAGLSGGIRYSEKGRDREKDGYRSPGFQLV